ncbi:MAG: iron-sulfur cluster repair di-iron protein [Rhodothermales bacterium]
MIDLSVSPKPFELRTVGEVVTEDYRRGITFKQFGIDFCCGGGKSIAEACAAKKVDVETLRKAIENVSETGAPGVPARAATWSASFLADYIVNQHHAYVRERVPVLRKFTARVAAVHGHHYTELQEIRDIFSTLADELEAHMADEEAIFPEIGRADVSGRLGELEQEHTEAGEAMARIRALSGDYTPPEGACNTFRAAYAGLKEFEEDLHAHVHLENNILFPKLMG